MKKVKKKVIRAISEKIGVDLIWSQKPDRFMDEQGIAIWIKAMPHLDWDGSPVPPPPPPTNSYSGYERLDIWHPGSVMPHCVGRFVVDARPYWVYRARPVLESESNSTGSA